jgi:hypothetical protein
MELVSAFWIGYFVLATTVFGISSILLYGSIFEPLRNFWFKHTGFLRDLFKCQLCISFWITFAVQWLILGFVSPIMYFFICCSVAGISWLLGAFTMSNLWTKALFQKIMEEKDVR